MVSINLCKVAYDSSSLQLLADCSREEKFSELYVEVRFMKDKQNPRAKFSSEKYDLSSYFADKERNHCALSIPMDTLGSHDHGIYVVTLKTELRQAIIEKDCGYCHIAHDQDTAITSDVNFVYDNFKGQILAANQKCEEIGDDLIRNYLILFGHHNAMALHDLCTAELYYKLLVKNFSVCGEGSGPCKSVNLSCGCGNGNVSSTPYPVVTGKSCGCK